MIKIRLVTFILALLPACVMSQQRKAVESSTDILMFLPSAAGAALSIAKADYDGLLQLVESGATAVAAAYVLKYTVSKRRPDGSDNRSFPSNHSGVAFAGATFLGRRYGWGYGAAGCALASYVAWGRVYSRRHDTLDVLAGAAIGVCSALIYTHPYAREHNMSLAPMLMSDGGCALCFSMNF